jgi:hypothetical protein
MDCVEGELKCSRKPKCRPVNPNSASEILSGGTMLMKNKQKENHRDRNCGRDRDPS